MNTAPLWEWVNERHAIYLRKWIRDGGFERADDAWPFAPEGADLEECDPAHLALSEPGSPLTNDPVLAQYRFCNVFRELDRVTQWIDQNIRGPFADHPDLWFMLATSRYINWPDTLWYLIQKGRPGPQEPGWPSHWGFSPESMGDLLDRRKAAGEKVYTGAYMIRAESNPKAEWYSWTKQQYIARVVLGRLWEDRELMTRALEVPGQTLENVWGFFQAKRYIGWGPFMAYQVVVDLRHTRYLRDAPDINTWSALGPGSRRGLNRLAGRPVDYALKQDEGLAEMRAIWEEQDAHRAPWVPRIDLSDIQNSLCEVDKLLRVRTGEGRPRAQYIQGRGF